MHLTPRRSLVPALLLACAAMCSPSVVSSARAQTGTAPAASPQGLDSAMTAAQWGPDLWQAARQGNEGEFRRMLALARDGEIGGLSAGVKESCGKLLADFAGREVTRAKELETSHTDLDKDLALDPTPTNTIKALRNALEVQMLTPEHEREDVVKEGKIAGLVARALTQAHEAEAAGNVLDATDLFVLLDALHDVAGTYRPDVRRMIQRQEMLRMYVPMSLWQMSNDRRVAAGDKKLPPYNAYNDDYHDRLRGVTQDTIERAVTRAREHVEQQPVNSLLTGGLDALRTMLTTSALSEAFPNLAQEQQRTAMLATIEQEKAALASNPVQLDGFQVSAMLDRVLGANKGTTAIPEEAILHEFGNGATGKLDEYTQVIWPDEVRRFDKNTQGRFVGIGVQIETDENLNCRIITPIEGTPAQRANLRPKDVITAVNGRSIFGLSLDQVVDIITGEEGTSVVLTVERTLQHPSDEQKAKALADGKADGDPIKEQSEFRITRARINVPTVKGWKRHGAKEDDWDWFLDKDSGVGYVRLSQFADNTTEELDRAIGQMRRAGLKGLVFDLRFNPGGLLDQAVSVAQRFIPFDNLPVVKAKTAGDLVETVGYTSGSRASLAKVPVVILTNEGSASASEIVSGCVSVFSHGYKDGNRTFQPIDAMVLGARTFGKGSVQNVWPLTSATKMKVTTALYMLPDNSIIHRRPGKQVWGVEPDFRVEMLPQQNSEALMIRRNADVLPLDADKGVDAANPGTLANPDDVLTKGLDLQLEAAKVLLQARSSALPSQVADDSKNAPRRNP